MPSSLRIAAMAIVMSATAFASLPALADDELEFDRAGYYAGVGIKGAVYTDFDDDLKDAIRISGLDINSDTAFGFSLLGGYRFTPNLAAELEFEMMPETDVDFSITGSGSQKLGEIQTLAVTGNVKAFALTGRFQPFALIGFGFAYSNYEDSISADVDEDEVNLAARFGGGVEAYITDRIVVWGRTTYLLNEADLDGVNLSYVTFGAGLQYRF